MSFYLIATIIAVSVCSWIFSGAERLKNRYLRGLFSILSWIAGTAVVLSPFYYEFPAIFSNVELARIEGHEIETYPLGTFALVGYSPDFLRVPNQHKQKLEIEFSSRAKIEVEVHLADKYYETNGQLCDFFFPLQRDQFFNNVRDKIEGEIKYQLSPALANYLQSDRILLDDELKRTIRLALGRAMVELKKEGIELLDHDFILTTQTHIKAQ